MSLPLVNYQDNSFVGGTGPGGQTLARTIGKPSNYQGLAGDFELLCVINKYENGETAPFASNATWTKGAVLRTVTVPAGETPTQLTFFHRFTATADLDVITDITWQGTGRVIYRTYRNAFGYNVLNAGVGLVTDAKVVPAGSELLRIWGNGYTRDDNFGSTYAPTPAGLVNVYTHNAFGTSGLSSGTEPAAPGATAPARTLPVQYASVNDQWVNVAILNAAPAPTTIPMYLGNTPVTKLYLGSTLVDGAKLGGSTVY